MVVIPAFFQINVLLYNYSTAGAFLGLPFAYLKRFMRLTGLYIMVLNFHNTLYKFFDIGPLSMVQITVK